MKLVHLVGFIIKKYYITITEHFMVALLSNKNA